MDRQGLNQKHLHNPMSGDYWNDMLCPVCVVLSVYSDSLIICKKTKDVGPDHWTWDLSKRETITRDEFVKWLSYGRIAGTWASVSPTSHRWAVDIVNQEEISKEWVVLVNG